MCCASSSVVRTQHFRFAANSIFSIHSQHPKHTIASIRNYGTSELENWRLTRSGNSKCIQSQKQNWTNDYFRFTHLAGERGPSGERMTSFSKLSRFEFADDGITKMKIIRNEKRKTHKRFNALAIVAGAIWTAHENENGCRLFVRTQNTTNRDDDSVVDNRKNIYYGPRLPPPFEGGGGNGTQICDTDNFAIRSPLWETSSHEIEELRAPIHFESLMMPSSQHDNIAPSETSKKKAKHSARRSVFGQRYGLDAISS